MPPGGGVPHGSTKQDHPPATGDDTPARSRPSLAAAPLVVYQRKKLRRKRTKDIPEGPLVNILSRLPYSALCLFKCVSKPWLALCSAPDIRNRSTQTLSGFFHNHQSSLRFRNLNGRGPPLVDPALPFLRRGGYNRFKLQKCSTSLLLCKCWKKSGPGEDEEMDLVVCNPATQEWTLLPPIFFLVFPVGNEDDNGHLARFHPTEAYLGFDAASCFVVLVPLVGRVADVVIYFSETGRWVRTRRDDGAVIVTAECVFLNGFMHLAIDDHDIFAVDAKGAWKRIPLPQGMEASSGNTSMGLSQGLLHAWYIDPEEYQLSVWVLEDYDSEKWTLKHTVDIMDLFDSIGAVEFCEVFAIHPERNLIFVTNGEQTTISYDMDSQQVHAMCNSAEFLGGLPYVPFFGKWLPDVI